MKFTFIFTLFFLIFQFGIVAKMYFVDPVISSISFEAVQLGFSKVEGHFGGYTVIMNYDEVLNEVNRIEGKVDVTSIFTDSSMRDRHLRSDRFFDILNFPDIFFVLSEVCVIDDIQVLQCSGEFRIKDSVRIIPLSFSFEPVIIGTRSYIKVMSMFELNRHDFGLSRYSLFIDDIITVRLELFFRENNV